MKIFTLTVAFMLALFTGAVHAGLTVTQTAKMLAGDGEANDQFGISVALSGKTAIIGSMRDDDNGESSGSAYIFTRAESGWSQQAKLVPDDGNVDFLFGFSVAISGDTAVVGSGGFGEEAAHVFVRDGSGVWQQQARLTASDYGLAKQFGHSVGISGDTIVVGSPRNTDAGRSTGSAYVFVRSGTTWAQQAKLLASDINSGDEFGISVAIDNNRIVIGANRNDDASDNPGTDSGSVYVFETSGSSWSEVIKLTADDASPGDRFGTSVAISGNTIAVGADLDDADGQFSGSAYTFTFDGTLWQQQAKLTPSTPGDNARFGNSIAISDDIIVAGQIGDDSTGFSKGAAYVFERIGIEWLERAKLNAVDSGINFFGVSVAVNEGEAVIGANYDDDLGDTSGSAYAYNLIPPDVDNDGVLDSEDNCLDVANPSQTNTDGADDGGDACDDDDDNDGVDDGGDNCRLQINPDQVDTDVDGMGDVCDSDDDNDNVVDGIDDCPGTSVGNITDSSGCGISQYCPCIHPDSSIAWKNHGAYTRCISTVSKLFFDQGLIELNTHGAIVSEAANISCGKNKE